MKRSTILALLVTAATVLTSMAVDARTVRWARSIDAQTMDPHAANIGPTSDLLHQIYEPLAIRGYRGELIPTLATEWRILPDNPNVWEFKLRPNVRFHNGATFTADDAVFSLARARAPTSDFRALISSITDVRKVDDLTIHIETRGPNPLLIQNMTDILMVNKAWTEANNAVQPQNIRERAENFTTRNAMGTGPYRLTVREPDVRTVMQLFDGYWGRGQVPLEVTEIVMRPIRENATRVAALLSGEVDAVHDLPVQDIARLQQTPGITVNTGEENRVIFLGFNVANTPLRSADIRDRNPFANRAVRQAINGAINREAITRVVMRGQGQPIGFMGTRFINGHTEALAAPPAFNVAAANAALDAAGFPRRAAEGNTRFSVVFHCTNDRYVSDEAICQAVVAMLGQIGIRAQLVARPGGQHFPELQREELDFFLSGWGIPTYDSEYNFNFLYHTRSQNAGTWNGTRFGRPDLDRRIIALQTMPDIAARNREIAELWGILKEETVYVPLHVQSISHAMRGGIDIPVHPSARAFFKFFRFRTS